MRSRACARCRGPLAEVAADTERARHRDVEAISERQLAAGERIRAVGDPGHHREGCVGIAEARLYGDAIEGVGVVRCPDLSRARQDGEVGPPPAARAGLEVDRGMGLMETIEDAVEILGVGDPGPLGIRALALWPARLGEVAVHVPLHEVDGVGRQEVADGRQDPFGDVIAREVEHELVALLGPRPVLKVQDPVRVRAVQVGVGVDHLGLDPDAKAHAELLHVLDQWGEAPWELLDVDVPITESRPVVFAAHEPAVIDDEELDAHLRGKVGELSLVLFVDAEGGRLPGVVEHRPQLW